jgi:hypothetical protein
MTVKFDNKPLTGLVKDLKEEAKTLPQESLMKFKSLTPVKSGNARRNTKLEGQKVVGDYAYSMRLDEGHSKQAPEGMIKPFEKWFKSYVEKNFRK